MVNKEIYEAMKQIEEDKKKEKGKYFLWALLIYVLMIWGMKVLLFGW